MKDRFIFRDLIAIIADYKYYSDNEFSIDTWLEKHDSERIGMVITFNNEQTKTLFVLRWT